MPLQYAREVTPSLWDTLIDLVTYLLAYLLTYSKFQVILVHVRLIPDFSQYALRSGGFKMKRETIR